MSRKTVALVAVVAVLVQLLTSSSTLGVFTASPAISGNLIGASDINAGNTPTVSVNAQAVTVSWAASTMSDGRAVGGYLVNRYDAGTGVVQTMLSACTGTVAATSCTENSVPGGSWKYTVTPVF